MTISLSALERAAREATPGPWYVDEDPRPGMSWNRSIDTDHKHGHSICMMTHSDGKHPARDRATADHIANCSPETILALVEIARAAKLYADHDRAQDWADLREALKGVEL